MPEQASVYPVQHSRVFYDAWTGGGGRVVYPAADELQIDIDSVTQLSAFERVWPLLAERGYTCYREPSRSELPEKMHITVTCPHPLEPWQRLAMQAALGSDPVREMLGCLRLMRGDENPTCLAKNPVEGV